MNRLIAHFRFVDHSHLNFPLARYKTSEMKKLPAITDFQALPNPRTSTKTCAVIFLSF